MKKEQFQKLTIIIRLRFSKIFKDFPLIGCPNTQWNAIINSPQFYPDEKRDGLMLHTKEQNSAYHVQQIKINNRQILNCYNAVRDLYIFLSNYCHKGLQNLLIFNNQNILKINQREFRLMITNSINSIINHPFIQTQNNKIISPFHLNFIQLCRQKYRQPKNKYSNYVQISKKINQVFKFLFNQQKCLTIQNYQDFSQILNMITGSNRNFLLKNKYINFYCLEDCLNELSKLSFIEFTYKMKNEIVNKKLQQIYQILNIQNIPYQQYKKYKIFLNQKNQFKDFQKDGLKIKKIPQIYQQIAKQFKIDLNQFLMNEQLSKNIKITNKEMTFDILNMQDLLLQNIKNQINNIFNKENTFNNLYRLLLAYNIIPKNTLNYLQKFNLFHNIQSFKFIASIQQLKQPNKKTQEQLKNIFIKYFCQYLTKQMKDKSNSNNFFSTIFIQSNYQQALNIFKQLFTDDFLGKQLCQIPLKLSCNNIFTDQTKLSKFQQNQQYPNFQDQMIYYILNTKDLKDRLILRIYPVQRLHNVNNINYGLLFGDIQSKYDSLIYSKEQVLQYAKKIYDQYNQKYSLPLTLNSKYKAWEKLIDNRVKKLFDLKHSNKSLENQNVKKFMFNLLQDEKSLEKASQIFVKNNNKLDFMFKQQKMGQQPIKKIKMQ